MTDRYPPVRRIDRTYDTVSVDRESFDNALVLKVWDPDHARVACEVRIAAKDIPDFMRDVVNHAANALRSAATNLAIGHCETCRNRRLIEAPHKTRGTESVTCPDCLGRRVDGLSVAPQIGDRLLSPEPDERNP